MKKWNNEKMNQWNNGLMFDFRSSALGIGKDHWLMTEMADVDRPLIPDFVLRTTCPTEH